MSCSERNLDALKSQSFDVVIIGGGISGAWLSLHCAQQGLRTALIEKHDYASQTSSSSSKLLHGGVRYLQQMQFTKVRESAMERAEYLYAAPHLSTPIPFLIPTYKDFQRSKFFLNCGMLAYRALCLGENRVIASSEQQLPPIRSLSAKQLNQVCDLGIEQHTGAVVLYERHMLDSERMVLAIINTARGLGAETHNYVAAEELVTINDRVIGVTARDRLSNEALEIKSRLVINAAGPWIDNLNSTLINADNAPRINGFAIGSHIVTRQLCDHAVALTTQHQSNAKIDRGGRHVFVIPWRGYSLIGTSYNEIENPNGEIKIAAGHVDQLLDAVNQGMPSANLTHDDLISGFSGLYPLQTDNIQRTVYQGSGEYQIIDHATANGVEGMVTALGAKFTTGRKLSALTMKLVNAKLSRQGAHKRTKLLGSDYNSLNELINTKTEQYRDQFSAEAVRHLIIHYGSEIDRVIERIRADTGLDKQICAHQEDVFGQVVWAIEQEQAVTLNDVLFNRTSLGLLGINDAEIGAVAELMARYLNWSEQELASQTEQVMGRIAETNQALQGT